MGYFRSSINARRFAGVLAATLSLGAIGVGGYNMAAAQSVSNERPVFIPIRPCRLIDTRAGDANIGPFAQPIGAETVTITAHGSNGQCVGESAIPTSAVGLSMNVTAVRATTQGTFLTFWGSGDNPGISNLNPVPGQPPTPNAVNTPLSDTGTFNLFNALGTVEVLIDVSGYYADHDHDDRYYTESESDQQFQTEAETDARYYTESESDQQFQTEAETDARYYTEAESDDRFLTQAELDVRYAQVDDLPFLAGGIVIDDETTTASVSGFTGPPGVTATVAESDVGEYTLTLVNIGGLTNPIIQITGIADQDPGALSSTGATACSISQAPPAIAGSTLVVGVGCFGEDDASPGIIVAEDVSFEFIVVG